MSEGRVGRQSGHRGGGASYEPARVTAKLRAIR
jgi:hypothetical protein